MRKLSIRLGVLLIVSLLLTELPSFLAEISDRVAHSKLDFYIKKGFSYPISVAWFLKFIFDSARNVIICYCGAVGASYFSHKLFLLFSLCMVYEVFDLFMFLYNYKTGYTQYQVAVVAICAATVILLFAKEKVKPNYKSLI